MAVWKCLVCLAPDAPDRWSFPDAGPSSTNKSCMYQEKHVIEFLLGNDKSLGNKLNFKVAIFDRHFASIYYMHGRQYN